MAASFAHGTPHPSLRGFVLRYEGRTPAAGRADGRAGEPRLEWTDAAIGCGYFDQAHLAREARALTGLAPTQLRADTVNFVQDDIAFPA